MSDHKSTDDFPSRGEAIGMLVGTISILLFATYLAGAHLAAYPRFATQDKELGNLLMMIGGGGLLLILVGGALWIICYSVRLLVKKRG